MEKTQSNRNTGLYHVLIETTSFCNLRCDHCYSTFENKKIIELEALENLAKTLKKMGCIFVTLSGGEPLTL
ncbi:MAG: radical SAM protein [bacterium]